MNKQALAMSAPPADATERGPDHLTVSPAPGLTEQLLLQEAVMRDYERRLMRGEPLDTAEVLRECKEYLKARLAYMDEALKKQ